jgi:hypothetical protein
LYLVTSLEAVYWILTFGGIQGIFSGVILLLPASAIAAVFYKVKPRKVLDAALIVLMVCVMCLPFFLMQAGKMSEESNPYNVCMKDVGWDMECACRANSPGPHDLEDVLAVTACTYGPETLTIKNIGTHDFTDKTTCMNAVSISLYDYDNRYSNNEGDKIADLDLNGFVAGEERLVSIPGGFDENRDLAVLLENELGDMLILGHIDIFEGGACKLAE